MEKIIYRLTLDTHKNGIQKTLQGFETADKIARRIIISLASGGDTFEMDKTDVVAVMYVTTPNSTEPSINACTIEDNSIIYDVLPLTEEGITEMQLKLIEARLDGAESVLVSPKFAVEVMESDANDSGAEQATTFTALEDALAKANGVYNARLLRVEMDADCMFRAYYADGTVYETDALKEAVYNGNALVAESFAKGGTGIREGEDTDNAKYYSNISRSASVEADRVSEEAKLLLDETLLHSIYTTFGVNFETGNLDYTSPVYNFDINEETGELETEGNGSYSILADGVVYNDKETAFDVDNVQDAIVATAHIAKGRNRAHVFSTTEAMQTFLSDESNKGLYNVGDNLYIVDVGVPDWWIAEVLEEADADTGYFYKIAQLETQKVDLTEIEGELTALDKRITTEKTSSANTYQKKIMDVTKEGFKWTTSNGKYVMNKVTSGTVNGKTVYIAVGEGVVAQSNDGKTWSNTHTDNGRSFVGVCYCGTEIGFLAISSDGYILNAGATGGLWKLVKTLPSGTWNDITYDPTIETFVAVGVSMISYSTNFTTWKNVAMSGNTFYSVDCRIGSMFVAAGSNSNGRSIIYFSYDGITWTSCSGSHTTKSATLYSVNYKNTTTATGTAIAVGTNGEIFKSANGRFWTQVSTPSGVDFADVSYDSSVGYIAVSTNGKAFRSSDGDVWELCDDTVDSGLNGVVYANGLYVAVGNKIIAYTNGSTYTEGNNIETVVTDHTEQIAELNTNLTTLDESISPINKWGSRVHFTCIPYPSALTMEAPGILVLGRTRVSVNDVGYGDLKEGSVVLVPVNTGDVLKLNASEAYSFHMVVTNYTPS